MQKSHQQDIAHSMIRFWGRDAARLALEYAQGHCAVSNPDEAKKWYGVWLLIVQIRNALLNDGASVSKHAAAA